MSIGSQVHRDEYECEEPLTERVRSEPVGDSSRGARGKEAPNGELLAWRRGVDGRELALGELVHGVEG